MTSMIVNFITGAGIKILAHGVWKMMELKRERDLAVLNAPTERLVALQGGNDTADPFTRWTRRILAVAFCGTWCFAIIHHLLHPEIEYTIMVGKSPSILFGWIFNTTNSTTIHLSAGSLLWDFKSMIEILVGFYFTKLGK